MLEEDIRDILKTAVLAAGITMSPSDVEGASPRGVRNNNPGNIKHGDTWKGEVKSTDKTFEQFFKILFNCPFIPFQENSKIMLSYYEYEKFSGINWHDDGKYTLNYSFYIHDDWDNNWGGETLIDTKRGLPLVSYPYPNTLLAIKNGIQHKVCPVTGPIKRKVLQVRGIFYE
mgnify:CR=1 FL=1